MQTQKFDLVILGSGSTAFVAAIRAAELLPKQMRDGGGAARQLLTLHTRVDAARDMY
jgi:hypothetical protein